MPRRGGVEPALLCFHQETPVVLHAKRQFVEVEEQTEEIEELNQMTAQSASLASFSTIKTRSKNAPNAPLLAAETEQRGHEGSNAAGVRIVHFSLRKKVF